MGATPHQAGTGAIAPAGRTVSGRGHWDPSPASDLRRRPGGDWADLLLWRSRWLPPEDCALLESVYRHGRTAIDIARLAHHQPRTIRRRIRRAVERAMSPRLTFFIANRAAWGDTRRRVGEAMIVQGCSIRETAALLNLSYHAVRTHRHAIEALYRTAERVAAQRGAA